MKKNNILCTAFIVAFISFQNMQAGSSLCVDGKSSNENHKPFKRTYRSSKRNVLNNNQQNGIEITKQDFSDHLSLSRKREVLVYNSSFTMNIGNINSGTNETWSLPNLVDLNAREVELTHTAPEDSGVTADFPGDVTHAVYSEGNDLYQLFGLTEDDLFLYGYGEIDNGVRVARDYYGTMSPVPLVLGLEYEGIVTLVNEDTSVALDSIQYKDIYKVIGQGTLKTFDDGDAEAIKLIYTEETREFKDGTQISFATRDEIVIYSKRGHYIRAGIDDAWNNEGEVTLKDINYQKIDTKTASTKDEKLSDVKTFPNPVSPGKILTIESFLSLNSHIVDVYSITGQKISRLQFSEGNNNQYQIKIPDDLPSGFYFYKVHDKKGNILTNGKIQIK